MRTARWVRVLGPVDLVTADGPHPVGGPRQRALLAALAVSAGRAVPIDQLQHIVWGDHPPRTAANTLQSHLSHVRDLIGGGSIERVDHAYRLVLDQVGVDSIEFTRLLRAAPSAESAQQRWQLTSDALALWRGQAFGDLADEETFALEAYRLDELRLVAMEVNISADLELGRHELVVGELECAVNEHPYRERLWHLLVESLMRSGRRIEALRACARWRDVLSEAGLDPGQSLVDLEQRVLAHDEWHPAEGDPTWFAP